MLRCSEQIKEHPIFAAINLLIATVTLSQKACSEWIGYNNTARVRDAESDKEKRYLLHGLRGK